MTYSQAACLPTPSEPQLCLLADWRVSEHCRCIPAAAAAADGACLWALCDFRWAFIHSLISLTLPPPPCLESRGHRERYTRDYSVKFDWGNTSLLFAVALWRKVEWEGYIGKERASRGVQKFTVAKGLLISQVWAIYTLYFISYLFWKIFNFMSFRSQVAMFWSNLCVPFCDYLSCSLISGSNPVVFHLQKASRSTSVEAFLQTHRPLCFLYLAW